MVSPKAIELITYFEGFSAKPYYCPSGLLTIGYGHVVRQGENFTTITEQQGKDLLKLDLREFEKAVTKLVKIPLLPHEFDALVSFVYNVGSGAFEKSTLLKLLNEGRPKQEVAGQFLRWCKGPNDKVLPGLARRRIAEVSLFLLGHIDLPRIA